ncbi:spectrin beta chain, non-erythrocytic 4 [Platysternon megacephalum]|uniref:Polymeric immunoglobulin receptor n=1 Tax=Platysternon megacephalum TaxID=55544 RepID=A0A4D9DZJ9_9SAUR|nr:spectrin beta chain, non-erythrocytic 4 [Platysternon megacephalum]
MFYISFYNSFKCLIWTKAFDSYFISKDYKDRASITDFPKNGTFTIQMTQLEENDAGAYRCGIGNNNKALFVRMNLTVVESTVAGDLHNRLIAKGSNVSESPELVLGKLRGSVTIQCQPENVKGGGKKFWCKLGKTGCSVIADSDGYVATNYEGRISITPEESSGTFKILINRLKKEDSGLYKCGVAMLGDSGNARTIDLQVTEESTLPREPRLLNGSEGGLVSAKCHYDPQRNYEMKYWCSWKAAGCSLVSNTSGFVQDAFEGRIRIISDNQENGTFTVVMSHLEEKDAGWYWCGAKDGDTEQTSSMKLHVQKESFYSLPPVPSASVSPVSPTSALHSIPSRVNVINQTYPTSRVTEEILEKTTPEDRFVTISNAVYESIPTHVNVINQTYPTSRVTEGILEKTTPEDRFVTISNAVYERFQERLGNQAFERNMTFLVFIFLLSFLQAESARISSSNPIFGPRQVTGLLGGSVTVKCFYPRTSVNRHDRKYWCKESTRQCVTVISSSGYTAQDFAGRATITDFPEQGIFTIVISKLVEKDTSFYKCGIGLNDRGLSFRVKLDVSKGPNVPEEAELYYIELGGSVTIDCAFGTQYGSERKYMCKMGNIGCSNVIDTYRNVNETYKGRVLLSPQEPAGSFSLYMTQLRKEDSGVYLCGAGAYGEKGESKELDLHVYQETSVPQGPHVIKGVIGGSVSVECHYDPRGNYTLKYWCKWRPNGCTQLITNLQSMMDSYEGRIVLHDNPENGTFTVIMNQLTAGDAGYYWCMTDGDMERKSTKELKIIDGQPGLIGPKEIDAVIGTRVTIPCSYPCKYYSYQKYWCKWHNTGCQTLISSEQNQTGLVVNCDKEKRTLFLTFDQVIQTDQGWYWCGVSHSGHYGETMAVYLTVNGDAAISNTDTEDRAGDLDDNSSPSSQEHDSSKVILSVLLPIAAVCLLLATVFVVVKFRLLKRTELVSVGSYRTNISMSEFENSRDYGAKDNVGINDAQETQLGGVDEFITTPGNAEGAEEPPKVKRGSKEEADIAYSTFLLQANKVAQGEA